MKKIHKILASRMGWYRKWHANKKSGLFHNLILALSMLLFSFMIVHFALTFAQVTFSVKPVHISLPDFYVIPTATPTQVPTPQIVTQPKTYTVQAGDTLFGIAQKFLGDGNRYPEIVLLNKDKYPQLAADPNLIDAGMVLIVGSETVILPGGFLTGERPNKFESGTEVPSNVLDFFDIFNIVALVIIGLVVVVGVTRFVIIRV